MKTSSRIYSGQRDMVDGSEQIAFKSARQCGKTGLTARSLINAASVAELADRTCINFIVSHEDWSNALKRLYERRQAAKNKRLKNGRWRG